MDREDQWNQELVLCKDEENWYTSSNTHQVKRVVKSKMKEK